MKLSINSSAQLFNDAFLNWLRPKIRDKIIADINPNKLKLWDNFFNNQPLYKNIYKKKISTLDLLIAGANNLRYQKSANGYYYEINPNIYLPGYTDIKLNAACKAINFGNQEMAAYPIFTETFNYFNAHIDEYMNAYLLGSL